jgi:hypothetical protein
MKEKTVFIDFIDSNNVSSITMNQQEKALKKMNLDDTFDE